MLKSFPAWLIAFLISIAPAAAQQSSNGIGSTTHSAVTTAYATGQLFALNTTGNAVASPITVNATAAGQQLIQRAFMFSSGTNLPPTITLWLFSAPPFTTSLVDRSAYIGPYAIDITSSIYIGSLTCSTWNKTNDGSAKYFAECLGSSLMINILPIASGSGQTTIYAMEEIGGTYTPLSSEKHTYFVSTLKDN